MTESSGEPQAATSPSSTTAAESVIPAVIKQLRLQSSQAQSPLVREHIGELLTAIGNFAQLLPAQERGQGPGDLLPHVAGSNVFDPLRVEQNLPVTVIFHPGVHPAYFEGDNRIGAPPWRLVYTDGGAIDPSPVRDRLLDEVIRLAEAMHDKNPFGEVPFDGGKTVMVQQGDHFQAVTGLYGDIGMSLFILAKGGVRYYTTGPADVTQKKEALCRWAGSSAMMGILGHKYIGGPDMRMGEEEMLWVNAAAAEMAVARRVRQMPAVTGLAAQEGGFPHQAWELTGRTVAASLKEALRHAGTAHYGLQRGQPISVLIQGFGDVGGSVARLLTEESPDFTFQIAGVADEFGAIYRAAGLDVPVMLQMRAERRPIIEYAGELDAIWVAAGAQKLPAGSPHAQRFRGTDSREIIFEQADVFIPAAIPNVIDAASVPKLKVRFIAEGANNAIAPRVEETLHQQGILYLPGQAMNWGGVKGSTLEVLFRELTKRTKPFDHVEAWLRGSIATLGGGVDVPWMFELLRSGLSGPPLDLEESRYFAITVLEDLARSNTRWLMNELVAGAHSTHPLALVKRLSRNVRTLKVQLLSLVEQGLGAEYFAPETSLARSKSLLDDKLKELLSDSADGGLTATQVHEQRQMLQQLQNDIPNGLSPVFASLLAALDLARQKVMDPAGYSQRSLERDLQTLTDAPSQMDHPQSMLRLEDSLYRLQRVHPGPNRAAFVRALANLIANAKLPPTVRRNAALALAKMGSADPRHRSILLDALRDADFSVRSTCRWALYQMGIPAPSPGN